MLDVEMLWRERETRQSGEMEREVEHTRWSERANVR